MRHFLGIDGGGSKTTALLSDEQGNILGAGLAGPTSGHFVGHEAVVNHLWAAAGQALDASRFDGILDLIFVGAPAVYQDTAQEALSNLVSHKALHCEGDDRTAFIGALGGAHGVVVLAGTGSFAHGVNTAGVSLSVGGWGTLLGDEGSAHAIALAALKAVTRAAEGRGPETSLTHVVRERFRITRIRELTRVVYRPDFTREQMASLAPLVSEAARQGDRVALRILEGAGDDLGELAATVIEQLSMTHEPTPVVMTGGVQGARDLILPSLVKRVKAVCPRAEFPEPRFEPAIGALILAMEMAGITVDEQVLQRLDQGAQRTRRLGGGRFSMPGRNREGERS